MLADIYQRKFTRLGFTMVVVADGSEVQAAIHEHSPNLVLLDRKLPPGDGLDILRSLRGQPETKDLAVILLTNLDPTTEERAEARALGAIDYLIKEHVDLNTLALKIKTLLGSPVKQSSTRN